MSKKNIANFQKLNIFIAPKNECQKRKYKIFLLSVLKRTHLNIIKNIHKKFKLIKYYINVNKKLILNFYF